MEVEQAERSSGVREELNCQNQNKPIYNKISPKLYINENGLEKAIGGRMTPQTPSVL